MPKGQQFHNTIVMYPTSLRIAHFHGGWAAYSPTILLFARGTAYITRHISYSLICNITCKRSWQPNISIWVCGHLLSENTICKMSTLLLHRCANWRDVHIMHCFDILSWCATKPTDKTYLQYIPTKRWQFRNTVETLYNTVNFCWSTHKRHSIARPKGRGMGCLLWVQSATYCVDLSKLSCIKYLL